jgi:adenylosuccinate lyase
VIERYSRPDMKKVWSDENKYNKWLDVEIAVCEAWAESHTPHQDGPLQHKAHGGDSQRDPP